MFSPVGGILEDAGQLLKGASSTVAPAYHVLSDPALPMVAGRISSLHDLEAQQVSKETGISPSKVKGIGLHRMVKPLDAYIWYRRNPWILPVALIGIRAIPFLLGYKKGRKKR